MLLIINIIIWLSFIKENYLTNQLYDLVNKYNNVNLNIEYKISSIWSNHEGSLILVLIVISIFNLWNLETVNFKNINPHHQLPKGNWGWVRNNDNLNKLKLNKPTHKNISYATTEHITSFNYSKNIFKNNSDSLINKINNHDSHNNKINFYDSHNNKINSHDSHINKINYDDAGTMMLREGATSEGATSFWNKVAEGKIYTQYFVISPLLKVKEEIRDKKKIVQIETKLLKNNNNIIIANLLMEQKLEKKLFNIKQTIWNYLKVLFWGYFLVSSNAYLLNHYILNKNYILEKKTNSLVPQSMAKVDIVTLFQNKIAIFESNQLNPILQDLLLLIHPPILYIGYIGILGIIIDKCFIYLSFLYSSPFPETSREVSK